VTLAYVGIGSNLERPREQVLQAFEELGRLPATRLTRRSSLYRSAPVGFHDQPDFINAVAELDSELAPAQLLEHLKRIEAAHGRERRFPNAPRTLDLDVLLHGKTSLQDADLILPHPRMHERAFVLMPLLEIAPEAVIPGKGPAKALLENIPLPRTEKVA
jgi:2-amino-4-hydroxy-6-hydroxymethyldihydropteridine diphosphokinase